MHAPSLSGPAQPGISARNCIPSFMPHHRRHLNRGRTSLTLRPFLTASLTSSASRRLFSQFTRACSAVEDPSLRQSIAEGGCDEFEGNATDVPWPARGPVPPDSRLARLFARARWGHASRSFSVRIFCSARRARRSAVRGLTGRSDTLGTPWDSDEVAMMATSVTECDEATR